MRDTFTAMSDTDPRALPTSVELAHDLIRSRVSPGDRVLDATAGNGHDTVFLAQLVGPTGHVFAMDVQEAAITSTRSRITNATVAERCTLILGSHHEIDKRLPSDARGRLAAIMFNLGWLPGHDKNVITQTSTTLHAVETALQWLRPGGILTIVAYPGHAGGDQEAHEIAKWASALPSHTHEVRHYRPANRAGKSPECWAIRPRPSD